MSTGILIAIGAAVVVFAVIVALYNALVRGKNMVEEAWSSIDVQLKRRHDLVPNLVSAVRQYASHEKNLFEEVSAARARSLSVQGDVAAQAFFADGGCFAAAAGQRHKPCTDPAHPAVPTRLRQPPGAAHRVVVPHRPCACG